LKVDGAKTWIRYIVSNQGEVYEIGWAWIET